MGSYGKITRVSDYNWGGRLFRQGRLKFVPAFVDFLNRPRHVVHSLGRGKQHPMLNPNSLPAGLFRVGADLNIACVVYMRLARAELRTVSMKLVLKEHRVAIQGMRVAGETRNTLGLERSDKLFPAYAKGTRIQSQYVEVK
jgi:hypothetical protein